MLRVLAVLILFLLFLAWYLLPWWGLPVVFVLAGLTLWFLKGRLLTWLFTLPFRAKGRVLRNASVDVHSIRPVQQPNEEATRDDDGGGDETEPEPAPRDYFEVDVTITPRPPTGVFTLWEIGELILVAPGKKWDEDDDSCQVVEARVEIEGKLVPDEGNKMPGPQRLRMVIGVRRGVRALTFGYYFERFGELRVPVEAGEA